MPPRAKPAAAPKPAPITTQSAAQAALDLLNGDTLDPNTRAVVAALLAVRDGIDHVTGQLDYIADDLESMRKCWS